MAEGERGSAALLVLAGGGMALLIALVLVVTIADLVVSRGQAQVAADAAALAAMAEHLQPSARQSARGHGGDPSGGDHAGRVVAGLLARANGGVLVECCGDATAVREVEVGVAPRSILLRLVVPEVRARAAAALEPAGGHTGTGIEAAAPSAGGERVWPVDGTVSSGHGMRVHPLTGAARMHAGLDVAAPAGTPIRAAAAGRVVRAGTLGGYGRTVDIAHGDGTVTRYAHQSRVLVAVGQPLAAGQVLGLVGSTGASTGPHLHFEVRVAGAAIDPLSWLPQDRQ